MRHRSQHSYKNNMQAQKIRNNKIQCDIDLNVVAKGIDKH